jgi:alpha-glucosidase
MADYTADGDKLHLAYSFNLLTPEFSAKHIRTQVEEFEARVKGGWASWSVGNHDSVRVVTRWGGGQPTPALAKVVLAMQLSLRGTPCLYQGDELALTEADVPFELLQDPYGITFWPEFKGRDGCRTPMPWTGEAPNAGFTTGKPWLPVDPAHFPRAVSLEEADGESALNAARRLITWRRGLPQLTRGEIKFFDAPEPVLALRRDLAGHPSILAVFNLGPEPVDFAWPEAQGAVALEGHGLPGSAAGGAVSLPAFGAWFGKAA